MSWQDTTLGEVCRLKRGYDLPKAVRVHGTVPIVSSSGISGYHVEAKVKAPGVVTGRYGTLGEVFYLTEDFWPLNTALYVCDFKGNDPRFVAALLESMDLGKHDGAAAVPGLNRNQLHGLPVRVPDRRGQAFIAGILDGLDDLIENNRRRVEVLEEMARAIYREWFVHFRYPGREDATFVDSTLGPIPEGWKVGPLCDAASLDRTSVQPSRSPEETFDHYSIPAFDGGQLPMADDGSTIKSGKFLLSEAAVMVSKLNPRIERTWFVEPAAGRRSVASTEFLVLRPATPLPLEWLYLLARSESFQERLRELSGGTSTSHQRAKPDDFLATDVVVPGEAQAIHFASAVGPQLRLARTLRSEHRHLASIRDLLLPRLVTGQIDVSSLDLDALVEGSVA